MAGNCMHHADVEAAGVCAGCAEPFCTNCLVPIDRQTWCGSCKVMTVANLPPPGAATISCDMADSALRTAIFGFFCLGIVLEPMALVKAGKARRMIAADPRFAGSTKVAVATGIAIASLLLWTFGVLSRVAAALR